MKAAIAGLGIIGAQWAKHLKDDGSLVVCWNRSEKPLLPLYSHHLSDLPKKAEIIHIVVADPKAVASVLNEVTPGLNSSHLVIQSSTIDPTSSLAFSAQVRAKGAAYLESPFTGSLPAAANRDLVFYVGGPTETLDRARPYLNRLGKSIFHIGTESQAATLKLVMNLQLASAVEALCEALSTARAAGISDDIFFDAFKKNGSYSGVAALKESKFRSRDFSPQFSVKHMGKDMRLLKESLPVGQLPVLDTLHSLFMSAEREGLSELDYTALIELQKKKG